MEFTSADRNADAEYSAGLQNYNSNVEEYNKNISKEKTTLQTSLTGLQEGESSSANTQALKQAGQHATAIVGVGQAAKAALAVDKAATPLKATADIAGAKVGEKLAAKAGGSLLGKVASKAGGVLSVVGDVTSIGLDYENDKANWGKMSTADKIANVADIGGAGLDMVGTGLMAFGGPLAGIGAGLKLFGDVTQVAAGGEAAVSAEESVSDKQADLATGEKADEAALGKNMIKQSSQASEAGSGTLAVARTSQL